MRAVRTFRNPKASLWQSAADRVRAGRSGARVRPGLDDPIVSEASELAALVESGQGVERLAAAIRTPAATMADAGLHCSRLSMALGEARAVAAQNDVERCSRELDPDSGSCDADWMGIAEEYARNLVLHFGPPPYRRHTALGDFVIEGKLPARARIAIASQLGTGLAPARETLRQIAARQPDVFIHLGDILYSGTPFEVKRYFLEPLEETIGLDRTACYSLCGNHDVYSGGEGYYEVLLEALKQPASYFCLRNDHWQFLALDTGLHARIPGRGPAYLEASELAWLKHKIESAGGRQTALLSHHPLFSAHEAIGDTFYNEDLYSQVAPALDRAAVWFWGHERRLAIYDGFDALQPGLARGRSLGRGAEDAPEGPAAPEVRILKSHPLSEGAHAYAIVELDGAKARISYHTSGAAGAPLFEETVGAAVQSAS